jgi:hypothetical protein
MATLGLVCLLGVGTASAAVKQPVDFFGGFGSRGGQFGQSGAFSPIGIAVNESGAGAADQGDVYVADFTDNRIQRFARDDHGTPSEGADDTYSFVSAWGAGVDSSTATSGYEVCTVAEDCREGNANGSNGALAAPAGIAVDGDTGDVYVADRDNNRISAYTADGTFLRSFGFDVVETGPDDAGSGYEVCVAASGDVCKAGVAGAGVGQPGPYPTNLARGLGIAVSQPDSNASSGSVFLADRANHRIDTYHLDGSSPAAIGSSSIFTSDSSENNSSPGNIAVDSRGIVYASNQKNDGEIERYDSENANGGGVGFLAPIGSGINEVQFVWIAATAGTFHLTYDGETTVDLPFDAPASDAQAQTPGVVDSVEEALTALPAIADGEVKVSGGRDSEPYRVEFSTGLGNPDVEQISAASGATPLSGDRPLVSTAVDGGFAGSSEQQQVSVNASAGQFRLTAITGLATGTGSGAEGNSLSILSVQNGALRVGDTIVCPAFPPGTTITAIDAENTLTLSNASIPGNFCSTVFVAETTADIAWNAPPSGPGSVQAALTALPGIGAGNIAVTGGPGDPTGSNPYLVTFTGALAGTSQRTMTPSNGTTPLSGGNGASAATLTQGQAGLVPDKSTHGFAVVPDSDGAGPNTDTLYVLRINGTSTIQQFGPANPPGLSAPPVGYDDIHVIQSAFVTTGSGEEAAVGGVEPSGGLAIDAPSGRIYVPSQAGEGGPGIYVLGKPGPGPSATFDSLSDLSATTVTAHATITPNGPPALSYHFEYSIDGVKWEPAPSFVLGSQKAPQSVSFTLNPGGGGLDPDTLYHIRLVAKRPFFAPIVSAEKAFTTLAAPPLAETIGSLLRTTTGVRLDGRIAPRNAPTTYHFEYGDQGPCDANPCTSTEAHVAGSGVAFELVSQQVEGLQPNTTYHYRVIAENANPGSPAAGEDMTVTTRGEEAPLTHGHLPGPPGSDRAWELVSAPDTGGNPVGGFGPATSISDAGDRAVYQVSGGTPDSEAGTIGTQLFAERTPSGWQTKKIFPHREDAKGARWGEPSGPSDLSSIVIANTPSGGRFGEFSFWRLSPDSPPVRLYTNPDVSSLAGIGNFLGTSDDGSRTLATLIKTQDPAHPVQGQDVGLYDFKEGSAQLISLLPDGSVPPCGVIQSSNGGSGLPPSAVRSIHLISADGSLAFFPTAPCGGAPERLYVRDIPAETTRLISPPPISGRECGAYLIKSIPGAAFFYSQSRLVAEDVEPESCQETGNLASGGDVYRYDLGDGALDCLTCVGPGVDGEVAFGQNPNSIHAEIGVAEDGSRLYFTSNRRLLPGAPATGGIYRREIASGDLAYVGAFGFIGGAGGESFMSPDGSVVVFQADDPSVNALGGQQNGAKKQFYRYDDGDRSLLCISCPADGSAAAAAAAGGSQIAPRTPGANLVPLSRDGEDFAFSTTRSLVLADQNTARAGQDPRVGTDIYEWRAGRLLLVSDGLINWPAESAPRLGGITPSGRDVFFTAATQYTQDALDGYNRLYDARIGGGFEFPQPPKPCPLEVCQGTPKGAPEEQAPGTATIAGAGNVSRAGRVSCAKPKRRVRKGGKTRCVKPARKRHAHKRANHNRRTAR